LSLEGRPRNLRGAPIAPAEIATRTHSHTASAETSHAYATHLIEDGWDAKFVQDQMGHDHASTTSLYTCVSSDYRVRTLRRVLDTTIEQALSFGEETS
jgi:site-specific recombinase XerD